MLTPKTIAMNAANGAPLDSVTPDREEEEPTEDDSHEDEADLVDVHRVPSQRGTEFRGLTIKETARFSHQITRRIGIPPEASTTSPLDDPNEEGHCVRIEPLPRLRVCQRPDEHVLRELRDAFDPRGRASRGSPAGLPGRRADAVSRLSARVPLPIPVRSH